MVNNAGEVLRDLQGYFAFHFALLFNVFQVAFVCGSENILSDVQEPAKCEYTMKFATPAACSDSHAEVSHLFTCKTNSNVIYSFWNTLAKATDTD